MFEKCRAEGVHEYWQSIYVDALQKRYPQPQYTGMNVLGAEQMAGGVAGAAVGKLMPGQGATYEWDVACVHPKYGTPAATAIADAMWDLWLSNVVKIIDGTTGARCRHLPLEGQVLTM